MPECQNCGAHVTERYARVFTPRNVQHPRVCPQCENMTRAGADPKEYYHV